ncbi:hypothetical protein [Kineosporia sp. R_H_3]|uniref:hypothetical protein n=1 Tax=Kineosporia sp. R_H_3 TaxID=1961848 RepID=UPI000B4BF667|nr:hypothetical protein [Kineosporia sp. R_H_3]
MTGSWYAQRFRPDGGITAEGLRNQLGRPALSLPTVLVRESAQNSWDAKADGARTVDFTMELATVGPAQLNAWRSLLSTGMPSVPPEVFPLRPALREMNLRYLSVSDRGTKGLGGPTRSDYAADAGHRNWLSFVLNSGEARDTEGGGGTYGYGKGVFFLASAVGTVLIYTRFKDDAGALRTRFIGSSLWASYTSGDRPFTGRHWWGVAQDDHCEPLVDAAADEVVRALGLPRFEADETGTTVTIIEPNLLDPTVPEEEAQQLPPEEAGRYLADAMGWNLWPLALEGRRRRLNPRMVVSGAPVAIPGEDNDAVIASFAAAYRRLQTPDGELVECKRPRRLLARFAVERTFGAKSRSKAASDLGLVDDLTEGEAPHHVCLMRTPELVVRYVPGPPAPHRDIGYAAVLRVEDDLDATFAKSEPPTHDAWIDSQLHGQEATFVRVARRRTKDRLDEIAGARKNTIVAGDQPVGSVARKLGHLLAGVSASGTGVGGPAVQLAAGSTTAGGFGSLLGGGPGGGGGSAGSGARAGGARRGSGRPRLEGLPHFVESEGGTVLEQRVRLPGRGRFVASVHVVTGDGKLESDPYAGAVVPSVIGWRSEVGTLLAGDTVDADVPCEVTLLVRPVVDATLDISVAVAAP